MPARNVPGLGLVAFWDYGSNFKDGMDADLLTLSVVTQMAVISRISAVPGGASNGAIYLLTDGANAEKIAVRDNGAWVYLTPLEGWRVYVKDTGLVWFYDGADWQLYAAEHLPIAPITGVTADTVQEVLMKLSHHIDFLDEHLRIAATEAGYTVPPYVPPA